MPLFFIITTLCASLIGLGGYMKAAYVEPSVISTPIVVPAPVVIETPVSVVPPPAPEPEQIPPPPPPTSVAPTPKPKPAPLLIVTNSDKVAPTAPHGLEATYDDSTVQLSWFASSDNIGVKGYRIYRDKKQISTTIETFYADALVSSPASHVYAVYAYDNAGNVSSGPSATPISDGLALNTSPNPTPTPSPAPSPTPTPGASPTPTPTPSPTPSPSPSPTPTPTPSPTPSPTPTPPPPTPPPPPPAASSCGSGGTCSAADVATHNTAGNCWIYTTSNNNVYNITAYIAGGSHPGGNNVITPYCGGNMTTFFTGTIGGHKHTTGARNTAMATYIGVFL